MDSYFPNERDLHHMREAARVNEQLRSSDLHSHLYDIQDVLEEQRRIEQDLRAADALRHLQEAAQLRPARWARATWISKGRHNRL